MNLIVKIYNFIRTFNIFIETIQQFVFNKKAVYLQSKIV